jgi:signal transduction histidine kinase
MVIFSDMLLSRFRHFLPVGGQDILKRVKSGAERMIAVIRDLLDYSRLSADRDIEVEQVDLSEIILSARDQLETNIHNSNADIQLAGDRAVIGNKQLLVLLFQNLLSNAIKFVANGTRPQIVITASNLTSAEADAIGLDNTNSWIGISITDNGIGFDERFLERIFEMFQRLHTQDLYDGTGIGLAICKRIVEMHRGKINATSEVSKGSVFTIYLSDYYQKMKPSES